MTLDFSRCRLSPFQHQREDVAWLLDKSYALIASEMRTGKSATVILAAQFLFERNAIDRVVVVAPAPVRDVWFDRTLGELAKHLWADLPATVVEYASGRLRQWRSGPEAARRLECWVTNYEYVAAGDNLAALLDLADARTLLVLDESSYVKNWKSNRTVACKTLRKACGRAWLLNGTPIFHSPMDLFSQGNLLHESVLDCKYVTHFKARYAVEEPVFERGRPMVRHGKVVRTVSGWANLDDLQRRFAPHTIRRLQAECLDLPEKLAPVTITAELKPATWRQYRDMRDDMVVWLTEQTVVSPATAAVKAMRLSQITSGLLGGAEDAGIIDDGLTVVLDLIAALEADRKPYAFDEVEAAKLTAVPGATASAKLNLPPPPIEVGREKLDACLWFMRQRLDKDPRCKTAFFCRFLHEAKRLAAALAFEIDGLQVATITSGQTRAERQAALALMKPETAPAGPAAVVCTFGTASFGLDFSAASACVTVSPQYSPGIHSQSMERAVGPKMAGPLAYYDVVAVGPKGQHTIDHAVVEARQRGEDCATWTSAAWVRAIKDE